MTGNDEIGITAREIVKIANIAHQVNKAYCESIGDFSQPDWKNTPEWQKQSAFNGIKYYLNEVENLDKKPYPCLVPYDQLSTEQKTKNCLFKAVVDCFKKVKEVSK